MTAKEFLQQAYFAQQEVDFKLEEMARLQALATRVTSTLKSTPSGTNMATSKIGDAVAKIKSKEIALPKK